MGEVYRATDTKLNREVAIKVLPPEVAQDTERLARFQREAQLLAALNHPNIAAIYGLEEADGKPFLALELVEGEDLKQRLERGKVAIEEAIEIAVQIAEALGEAHASGIVHRDLKPANVKLTPDGKVKVLDFGLAKAWGGDAAAGGSSIDLSQSPTLARTGTLAGVILGTAAYMSPEQASGKAVDKRADIWSFGVVLFEMLTGQPLFTGETASEVMASVIKEDPDWDRLPPDCPRAVSKLLRRCLRKRPRERLQDIGDARLELADVLAGVEEPTETRASGEATADVRRGRARERWGWLALTLALAGLAAVLTWRGGTGAAGDSPVLRAELRLPPGLTLAEAEVPTISPDGSQLAFVVQQPGEPRQLWLRPLDETEAHVVRGTDGTRLPFWAPDSAALAFASEDHLNVLRLGDEIVQRVCALPGPRFAMGDWSEEGLIVFSSAGPGDLYSVGHSLFTVPARGGEPEPLTTLDESRGETRHIWPVFLPGGAEILVAITATDAGNEGVYVLPVATPSARRRLDAPQVGVQRVRWASAGGHLFLLYRQDDVLLAQPFDPGGPSLSGVATPIAAGLSTIGVFAPYSLSSTGMVVHIASALGPEEVRLQWVGRDGTDQGALDVPGRVEQLVLSPDGTRVAVQTSDQESNIWVIGAARGLATRATFDGVRVNNPVWSPDGDSLVYSRACDGKNCLFRTNLAEGVPSTPVVESDLDVWAESWTRHGNTLVYLEGPLRNRAVRTLSMDGSAEPELLLQTGYGLDETQVSPDGRWLAYLSDDSGEMEVYIRPFRRPGERVRVSAHGGGQPKWRADGKELFYVSPADRRLTAVEVRTQGDSLELGTPSPLFEVATVGELDLLNDLYAPAPDGQRFLVAVPDRAEGPQPLQLTLNWPALVR